MMEKFSACRVKQLLSDYIIHVCTLYYSDVQAFQGYLAFSFKNEDVIKISFDDSVNIDLDQERPSVDIPVKNELAESYSENTTNACLTVRRNDGEIWGNI